MNDLLKEFKKQSNLARDKYMNYGDDYWLGVAMAYEKVVQTFEDMLNKQVTQQWNGEFNGP